MQIGLEEIRALRALDRKKLRRRTRIMALLTVLLFLAMCCMRTTALGFVSPVTVAKNLWTMLYLAFARLFHWSAYGERAEIILSQNYYYETAGMFRTALTVLSMGAALAMAGGVYQCVFRNPIATPAMLGVSSSISITNLILVLCYSSTVYQMVRLRFTLCYAVALGSLIIVYLISRLMSNGKKSSVTDMLFVGTVFMRLAQNFIQVFEYYYLDEEDYLLLEELNTYGASAYDAGTLAIMFGVLFVCILMLVLTRYSLNVVSFADEDARTLGLRPGRLRVIALVCATLMVTAAQVNYGDIGLLGLLIPHVCRYWFGSDFRNVLMGSAGLGAIAMLLCRTALYFLSFHPYLYLISMGTLINLITMPLLVVILLQQRRGWQ